MPYTYDYPRPAVAADIILIAGTGSNREIMLIKRGQEPFENAWAFPGGFMEIDETIETAALRELEEETGITNVLAKQIHVASSVDRDPRGRVLSVVFLVEIESKSIVNPKAADDAKEVGWFNLNDLPDLAFDHGDILKDTGIILPL